MSNIPVREMIKNTVTALGGKAKNTQIFDWIDQHYPNTNHATISAHLLSLSVNVPTRIHTGRNKKPRTFNPDYDFLYKLNKNEYELYEPSKHGKYELIESDGKTVVAKDGKPISNEDESSLLTFLQNKMQMNANYQPIVIKTLIEKGSDEHFTASLDEIKEILWKSTSCNSSYYKTVIQNNYW